MVRVKVIRISAAVLELSKIEFQVNSGELKMKYPTLHQWRIDGGKMDMTPYNLIVEVTPLKGNNIRHNKLTDKYNFMIIALIIINIKMYVSFWDL